MLTKPKLEVSRPVRSLRVPNAPVQSQRQLNTEGPTVCTTDENSYTGERRINKNVEKEKQRPQDLKTERSERLVPTHKRWSIPNASGCGPEDVNVTTSPFLTQAQPQSPPQPQHQAQFIPQQQPQPQQNAGDGSCVGGGVVPRPATTLEACPPEQSGQGCMPNYRADRTHSDLASTHPHVHSQSQPQACRSVAKDPTRRPQSETTKLTPPQSVRRSSVPGQQRPQTQKPVAEDAKGQNKMATISPPSPLPTTRTPSLGKPAKVLPVTSISSSVEKMLQKSHMSEPENPFQPSVVAEEKSTFASCLMSLPTAEFGGMISPVNSKPTESPCGTSTVKCSLPVVSTKFEAKT